MTEIPGFAGHRDTVASGAYLRTVNYHNTPAEGREALRAELAAYAARFRSLSLRELDRFFEDGTWPGGRPGFVPVFYEGYRNSHDVAAQVCDELGITGWFAVCTGFVECPPDQQELFARSHRIGLVGAEMDGRRLAMTWDEVATLSERHVVFAHTSSHAGTADVTTVADLQREVHEPKARLDAVTGHDSAAHAWLRGTPFGASPVHDAALVQAGYRYVISNTMIQRIGPPVG